LTFLIKYDIIYIEKEIRKEKIMDKVDLILNEVKRVIKQNVIEKILEGVVCSYENSGLYDLFDASNDYLLELFIEHLDPNNIGCEKIANGVQSIVFIFEDIVYKMTIQDLDYINSFIDYIDTDFNQIKIGEDISLNNKINPSSLISPVTFVCEFEGVYIYSQEAVDTTPLLTNSESPVRGVFTQTLANNIYAFYMQPKEAEELILNFSRYYNDFLDKNAECQEDIHNGNWGYNKITNQPVIFDPFYFSY
jgi:hypothetical protein